MMKTKPVATTLLIVMAIIFLISYPHRHDALWAFIMHVSGAAMIGGLADWYAVTALFTKPLGIPFKTAILPRSKERLIRIASGATNVLCHQTGTRYGAYHRIWHE